METLKNLSKAFIGESMARNRYSYFAKVAKKEGYEELSEIFNITADNEREHAKWLLRMINQIKDEKGMKNINITTESEVESNLGNSIENLKSAINGENHEHTEMYPLFADIAEKEGYPEIAKRLRSIAIAELHHEERFKYFLKNIENNSLFNKENEIEWFCRNCGYLHYGKSAPESCPSCDHPIGFFETRKHFIN